MIEIKKSFNADSRTNASPTKDELLASTKSHISDVQNGMNFMADLISERGKLHDHTKLEHMDDFYNALLSGRIKDTDWYHLHTTEERHHLLSYVHQDITLVDVIEHVVDCTMAGLARSGVVYDVVLPPDVLSLAVKNTVELLKKNTEVVSSSKDKDLLDEEVL